MTTNEKFTSKWMMLSLYTCAFILLWEWLRPLKQLTDTAQLSVFILFILLSLLLPFFRIHVLIRTGIKGIYVLFALNQLYFEESFFQFTWISSLVTDFFVNVGTVFRGDWFELSNPFRSLLFFLLLALMTYLLHYWLITRKRIFIFFFMTLLYITVLDTFTPYDARYAIIRTVIVGFALMGSLTFYRILEEENVQGTKTFLAKWLAPLIMMIGAGVIVGVAVPKASPIWPDPVPYLTSYSQSNEERTSAGLGKVGYGADDSQLGGPFIGDNTVVYETEADVRQYWKVESKDVYSGKGWFSSSENDIRVRFEPGEEAPLSHFATSDQDAIERTSIVRPVDNHPHIIYPMGIKAVENEFGHHYELDLSLEKIYVLDSSGLPGLGEYEVAYDAPRYSIKAMMSVVDDSHSSLTEEFLEQYTQLPESLPQRVKDLAMEITREKDNWYDKVKAVEDYFHRSDYQYDQTNVAVPGENDDYVDQFLFETKRGYCDNFSTSMVVMLRSLGIPTRWAKGYTEGDYRGMGESGKREYIITNNNAHSWVEVFFPEVGWVPFEPTKGFNSNAIFANDHLNWDREQNNPDTLTETPEAEETQEDISRMEAARSSTTLGKAMENVVIFFRHHWQKFALAIFILSTISGVLFWTRLKWLPSYFIIRFKGRVKDEDFPTAYMVLLEQLGRYGLKRKPEQTLREYASYVDAYFSSNEMSLLTATYERYLYRGELEEGVWGQIKQLWENLIKRTRA